jgi:hypothetical protein
MTRFMVALIAITMVTGCASDPGRREKIIKEHSGRLQAPTPPL